MTCGHCATERAHDGDVCTCRTHDCTATMVGLVDVVMRNSMAVATAALSAPGMCGCAHACECGCDSGPGSGSAAAAAPAAQRIVRSRPFDVPRLNIERRVTVETPLSTGYLLLPQDRITLLPSGGRTAQQQPLGILHPGDSRFGIEIDATGLPGAVYFGSVRVRSVDNSSDHLVSVYIEL